jgi:hypothetical protein
MDVRSFYGILLNALINRARRLRVPYLLSKSARTYPKIAPNVSRLTKGTIIKRVREKAFRLEAEATRYIALHISIPVSAIYDFWVEYDGRACLMMEYKDGETLQRHWRHLSMDQKMEVMCVLRGILDELHNLCQPYPKGSIGSVSGKAFFDLRISGQSQHEPFRDEVAYNDWRISTFSFFGEQH